MVLNMFVYVFYILFTSVDLLRTNYLFELFTSSSLSATTVVSAGAVVWQGVKRLLNVFVVLQST
jgi:hypothetical protein